MDKHHLSVMRCAYLDLYGFMEELHPEGWKNIPAYETLQGMREIFKTEDPEFYKESQTSEDNHHYESSHA